MLIIGERFALVSRDGRHGDDFRPRRREGGAGRDVLHALRAERIVIQAIAGAPLIFTVILFPGPIPGIVYGR